MPGTKCLCLLLLSARQIGWCLMAIDRWCGLLILRVQGMEPSILQECHSRYYKNIINSAVILI